jgi:hypothetical protein
MEVKFGVIGAAFAPLRHCLLAQTPGKHSVDQIVVYLLFAIAH